MCVGSSGKKVLFGTPHAAIKKTSLWPTFFNHQGVFFVFYEKKTCFLAFFPIQIIGAVLVYRKNRSKNAKKHTYMAVGQFQCPPCRLIPFWKTGLCVLAHLEKRCFLERLTPPTIKKHHFGPPSSAYVGCFSCQKNVFLSVFSYTNFRGGPCDLYRKNRSKNA